MKRVAALLAIQAALVGVYLIVEARRAPEAPFAAERLAEPAPPLRVETRGGPVELAAFGDRPVLVHFWATWCLPCRDELPGLIAASRETGVPLLAVTDEAWAPVAAYFGGDIPPEIARDPTGDGARRFEVSGLPDTFVVVGGELVARTGGPRDWSTRGARGFLDPWRP